MTTFHFQGRGKLSNCESEQPLFFFNFFFGPRSILWNHWSLLFWTLCVLPHGFQIQSGYLTCTLSCLCALILKVTTGATPAFSTNRGVHCIRVYMAWLARLLSHALGFEPPTQWWVAHRCVTKSDALPSYSAGLIWTTLKVSPLRFTASVQCFVMLSGCGHLNYSRIWCRW